MDIVVALCCFSGSNCHSNNGYVTVVDNCNKGNRNLKYMDRTEKIVIILYTIVFVLVISIIVIFEVSKCKMSTLMSYFP